MALDWSKIQEESGNKFKAYYADGKYKAKCDGVEIKEVGSNGSVIMKFHFEETEQAQFPTADHWLSFKNDSWRAWHNKCLMVVLGASEENAKKAVEVCESKGNKDDIVKAYEQTYKKLLAKKPEVEIEVYTENTYARAEFTDRSVAMPHDNEPQKEAPKDEILDNPIEGAEEVDLTDLPF